MMVMHVMTVVARISQRYSNGRDTTCRRKIGPGWTELSELRGLPLDAGPFAPGAGTDDKVAGWTPPRVDDSDVRLVERTLPSRTFDGLLEKYNLRTADTPDIPSGRHTRVTRNSVHASKLNCYRAINATDGESQSRVKQLNGSSRWSLEWRPPSVSHGKCHTVLYVNVTTLSTVDYTSVTSIIHCRHVVTFLFHDWLTNFEFGQ